MIDNKLLAKFKIDEIYGLHVTLASIGQILVKPNEMYAYQKEIRIELKDVLSNEEIIGLTTKIRNSLIRPNKAGKPLEMNLLKN